MPRWPSRSALATLVGRWVVEASRLASVVWHAALATSLAAAGLLIAAASVGGARFEAIHWTLAGGSLGSDRLGHRLAARVDARSSGAGCRAPCSRRWLGLEHETWYREAREPWLDPWTLEDAGHCAGGAGAGLGRGAVRRASRERASAARRPPGPRGRRAGLAVVARRSRGDRGLVGTGGAAGRLCGCAGAQARAGASAPAARQAGSSAAPNVAGAGAATVAVERRATCPRAQISNGAPCHMHTRAVAAVGNYGLACCCSWRRRSWKRVRPAGCWHCWWQRRRAFRWRPAAGKSRWRWLRQCGGCRSHTWSPRRLRSGAAVPWRSRRGALAGICAAWNGMSRRRLARSSSALAIAAQLAVP